VTEEVLEQLLFRAAHGIVNALVTYPGPLRVALLPSVVRMMLGAFLEDVASQGDAGQSKAT